MMEMEEIFFSGTFGGELLSLAAAKKVLQRHLTEDICGKLTLIGEDLNTRTQLAASQSQLNEVLKISGHSTWRFLNWSPIEDYSANEIKTYVMQQVFANGLLVLLTHNVTLAHTPKVLDRVSRIYNRAFTNLHHAIEFQTLRDELKVNPLVPLFKVR